MSPKNNVCRLCLALNPIISIEITVQEVPDEDNWCTKIKQLLPEINIGLFKSSIICKPCSRQVDDALEFRKKVDRTEVRLRTYISSLDTKTAQGFIALARRDDGLEDVVMHEIVDRINDFEMIIAERMEPITSPKKSGKRVLAKCEICGKNINKKSMLLHQQTHSSDHICPDCGKSFMSRRKFNEHRRIHTSLHVRIVRNPHIESLIRSLNTEAQSYSDTEIIEVESCSSGTDMELEERAELRENNRSEVTHLQSVVNIVDGKIENPTSPSAELQCDSVELGSENSDLIISEDWLPSNDVIDVDVLGGLEVSGVKSTSDLVADIDEPKEPVATEICVLCRKRFHTTLQLSLHYSLVHNNNLNQCSNMCFDVSVDHDHNYVDLEHVSYIQCSKCPSTFTNPKSWYFHSTSDHIPDLIECFLCESQTPPQDVLNHFHYQHGYCNIRGQQYGAEPESMATTSNIIRAVARQHYDSKLSEVTNILSGCLNVCPICQCTTNNLLSHLTLFENGDQHCSTCNKGFRGGVSLVNHLLSREHRTMMVRWTNNLSCLCETIFFNEDLFLNHVCCQKPQSTNLAKVVSFCKICKYRVANADHFQSGVHMARIFDNNCERAKLVNECEICFKEISPLGNYKRHFMQHLNKMIICPACNKTCWSSSDFSSHWRNSHSKSNDILMECSICCRRAADYNGFVQMCGSGHNWVGGKKIFNYLQDVWEDKYFERTNYTCQCESELHSESAIYGHMHVCEFWMQCLHCDTLATSREALALHYINEHHVRYWQCKLCAVVVETPAKLQSHIQERHVDYIFEEPPEEEGDTPIFQSGDDIDNLYQSTSTVNVDECLQVSRSLSRIDYDDPDVDGGECRIISADESSTDSFNFVDIDSPLIIRSIDDPMFSIEEDSMSESSSLDRARLRRVKSKQRRSQLKTLFRKLFEVLQMTEKSYKAILNNAVSTINHLTEQQTQLIEMKSKLKMEQDEMVAKCDAMS